MKDTLIILAIAAVAIILGGAITWKRTPPRVQEDKDYLEQKLSLQRGGKEMIELNNYKQALKYYLPIAALAVLLLIAFLLTHR